MAKPKLEDVAAVAGVSPTTVSRVLNNRGYISSKTRNKVQSAMQQINYRPNAIARSLQEQKTHLIGLVFPTVANPFYGELAYRIESKLADAGYKVILCNSEDHPELEARYLDMLLGNQVDGVITGAHSDVVANSPHLDAPLVTIDRVKTGKYPNIRSDNYDGALQASETLLAGGAKNIVHFTSTISATNLRQRGYRDALKAAGVEPRIVELGFKTSNTSQEEAISNYLNNHPEVDAVFASNDTYAALALQWATLKGRSIPDDLQVIGFDGTGVVRTLLPHLATVVQPLDLVALRAVDRLLAAVNGKATSFDSAQADSAEQAADILPVQIHYGSSVRRSRVLS